MAFPPVFDRSDRFPIGYLDSIRLFAADGKSLKKIPRLI
jgi:hypothetical protein